ncbi:MAG: hypothetical protein JJU33_10160 [Phycisphaerales bacterium]|nr:hypothetical protein [Phycisphaerales bacterium]
MPRNTGGRAASATFLRREEVVEEFDGEAELSCEGAVDGFVLGEVAESVDDELSCREFYGWGSEGLDGAECFECGLEGGA